MANTVEKGGQLRVSILGQTRMELDGAPFRFKAVRKVLPLLGYLVLHNRGPVSRDQIAFTLWPDDEEETALANLRRNIYLLTRALPPAAAKRPWLLVDAADVQWNPEAAIWLDIDEFERLSNEPQIASAEAAVALYDGDLLAGNYEDWIFAERERLRSVYLRLLGQLIDDRRRKRELKAAIEFARRILSVDPWREDTLRVLLSLRYESGDGAGALAEFDAFAKRLREEMNVAPMPETVALRERIERNAEIEEPPAAPEDAPLVHLDRRALPFVGREDELSQLRTSWSRASRRAGGFVLVGGEAGIGKSRLLDEFAYDLEGQGARVLRGNTGFPEAAPYQALAEALRSVLPVLAATQVNPMWLAAIAQVVPELRLRRKDLPALPALPADREQTRLQEAFVAAIDALGRGRPTLVILEDLHHAGEATLAAVEEIARRTAGSTVMTVATYREDETTRMHPLRRMRRRLSERGLLQYLSPTPLPRAAIDQLVELVPALVSAGPGVAAALQERSEGNALFLSEAIRDLLEGGAGAGAGVRATISARVGRLGDAARTFAANAAVAGTTFDVDLVRDVTSWSEDQALESLDELLDRSIVREAGASKRYAYEFTHRLVQATIYDEIPEEARVRRHRRVARVLEERGEATSADLAFHYERGRVPGTAARHYFRAAEAALALGATDDALASAERALALADDAELRSSLLLLREDLHRLSGARAAQLEDLDLLRELNAGGRDANVHLEILIRRAALARATGHIDEERRWLDALGESVKHGGDATWQVRLASAEARRSVAMGNYAEAARQAGDARELSEGSGDKAGLLEALCILTEVAIRQGRMADGEALLSAAQQTATDIGRREALARATMQSVLAATTRQAAPEAKALCESAIAIYREVADRQGEAEAISMLAVIEFRLGNLEQSRRSYEAAMRLAESIDYEKGIVDASTGLAYVELRLGRFEGAETTLLRAREGYGRLNDARGQLNCDINLSAVALQRNDLIVARLRAEAALESARRLGLPFAEASALNNLGVIERESGHFESAVEHFERGLKVGAKMRAIDTLDMRIELVKTFLAAGQLDNAAEIAEQLQATTPTEASGLLYPFALSRTIADVLSTLPGKEAQAAQFRERAQKELELYVSVMDEEQRSRFLALPMNR